MTEIDHEYWARLFLQTVVSRVRDFQGGTKYVTYGELARTVGYPEPHTGNLFGRNIGKTHGQALVADKGRLEENHYFLGQSKTTIWSQLLRAF